MTGQVVGYSIKNTQGRRSIKGEGRLIALMKRQLFYNVYINVKRILANKMYLLSSASIFDGWGLRSL